MELLKTFQEDGSQIGTATREEVHQKGFWHETFSCWFVGFEKGVWTIYLQLRSEQKENYPGLLDITTAGHLLSSETVEDGVREIKEELGIDILFEHLYPVGVIPTIISSPKLIDREFIHTYIYHYEGSLEDFHLQETEVEGIVKGSFLDFEKLFLGEQDEMKVEGITNKSGIRVPVSKIVNKDSFVPIELNYYKQVIFGIREYIKQYEEKNLR